MINLFTPALLVGLFSLFVPATAQEAVDPGQDSGVPALIPAAGLGERKLGNAVEDIDLHRVEQARYVRRQKDIVPLNLDGIDINQDPILTVDGKPLSRGEFRRRAIMYLGLINVDQAITGLVSERQRDLLVKAGADVADFAVTRADIDAKMDSVVGMLSVQALSGAADDPEQAEAIKAAARESLLKSVSQSMGMDAYRTMLASEVEFEKVFLPMPAEATGEEVWDMAAGPLPADDPKPDWMPQASWNALEGSETNRTLRYFVKKSAAEGSSIPGFFKTQIVSSIRNGVIAQAGLELFFDTDMPDDAFLRIGDHYLSVDELYEPIAGDLTDVDIDLILRETLTLRAIKKTLKSVDEWIGDEQAEQVFKDYAAQFEGTLFPLTSIIQLRGYLNMNRYREHHRYKQSYTQWRGNSVTDEELEDHYRTSGRLFFERGAVTLDMAYKWLDSDEPVTKARFQTVTDKMQEAFDGSEGDFQALIVAFPKPPTPQTVNDPTNEADRTFQRNALRVRMTESELSIFVNGYSMADDLYYHGVDGEVFGPVWQTNRRHAWGAEMNVGVWMGRVQNFITGRSLSPLQGREFDQCKEDYLDLNYSYWSQECLKALLPSVKVGS
jgi:hypothetical protein